MARKGKKDQPEIINGNVALPEDLRPVEKTISILSAEIKDGFCHYTYEYLTGVEKGNRQKSNSIYVVTDDMNKAFARFNVHLAVIDDLFKNGGVEVDDVDKLHDHEFTFLMETTGFKIVGDEDNESIVLIGSKYVSAGGRIKIETPKIPLDNLSSYKWYNELKTAADNARQEVILYKGGKYIEPEEEVEEKETKKQTKMKFEKPVGEDSNPNDIDEVFGSQGLTDSEFENDSEFEKSRV